MRVRQYTGGTLDKEEVASPSTYYGKTWENESLLFFSSVSVFVGDTGACHYDNDWTLHRSLLLHHLSNIGAALDIVIAVVAYDCQLSSLEEEAVEDSHGSETCDSDQLASYVSILHD